MGHVIGEILRAAFDKLEDLQTINRETIAEKLREIADGVERGDIVPTEALKRAQERQDRTKSLRDSLPA